MTGSLLPALDSMTGKVSKAKPTPVRKPKGDDTAEKAMRAYIEADNFAEFLTKCRELER